MGMVANSANLPERSGMTPAGQADKGAALPRPRFKPLSHQQWQRIVASANTFASRLTKEIEAFWGQPVRASFFAASTDTQYFWRLDDFFVAQAAIAASSGQKTLSNDVLQLRLSEELSASLMGEVLGAPPAAASGTVLPFAFTQLTNFEGHLLNQFSRDILKLGMKHLVNRKAVEEQPSASRLGLMLHLVWTVEVLKSQESLSALVDDEPKCGKLILSLPLFTFRPAAPQAVGHAAEEDAPFRLGEAALSHAMVPVRLQVGDTRVRLEDLQALEVDDMLLLENSNAGKMALIHWDEATRIKTLFPFTPRISNSFDLEIPYTQEIAMMEAQQTNAKVDLWENLEIDVAAEFFPTKLPLKHLREMSEGEVVEVADLVRNQIRIHVDGRTVALGELVIVGDKFGVRVTQLKGLEAYDTPAPSKVQTGLPGMGPAMGGAVMGGGAMAGGMPPQPEYGMGQPAGGGLAYGDPQQMGGGDYGYGDGGALPNPDDLDSMLNSNFDNDSESWS